ncbi:portal protein [Cytobacillus oceanisediminis]|uniref:portal protein n=1 Tax=Cytobacillus oceanisediminis TaxID=665099 RepID=UPI00373686BC
MKVLEDNSMYKKIVGDFRNSLSSLSELHSDFREFDDFYLAKHWNSQRASWRPDPIVNYVSYIVDMKAPQLTNNRPSGLILPTAQGDEDAAKLFTQVTDVVAERVDLDDRIDQYVRTGLLLGTSFMKVYWDNSLSGGHPSKQNMWKGDIAIDLPDPSNIYPDPQATSVNDCRYIIYAVPKTIQWVEQQFNVKLDPENNFETEIYDRPSNNYGKDRVMFYEYWHKDKKGIHCIYAAGGQILKRIEKVYKHGRYPFVPFVPKKNRKSLWGIGEPKNIINNQKLLNKLVELPTTNAILHANPIVLIDPRSGINPKQWVNKPGQIWNAKDPNNAVHIIQPPQLTNDVYKLADKMTEYIERIGGLFDATTGETPSGVTAAAAIQMLQEQGSIPIKGISRNLYQSIKDIYELMIELIKENYTETRYIRIVEDNGAFEFKEFNASQYAEIDFDVKVSAGASTPTSKAFIAQLGNDLFDKGILLPSEFVEMQEGLPNRDKIVQRLREQEGMQTQQQNPTQPPIQQTQPEQTPLDFNSFVQNAPPELQQEIQLMIEQGMSEDQIMEMLLAPR